jgi:RNA polymerase sigma-70 factor (ECF subfamily)
LDANLRGGEDTDEALMARAGRGDRLAASALVLRHSERVFGACWRMLGNRDAAEDATQETFLRLWTFAPRWRAGEASLATWLYRVSANVCIDSLRKRRREAPEEAAPERADETPGADDIVAGRERASALKAALDALPERQRLAIVFRHYEELPNPQAAAVLGVSVEALESLLARGRRALRAALSELERKSPEPRRADVAHPKGEGESHEAV